MILDEIQYAPELLPVIKRRLDQNQQAGQYFLTGSQNLSLIKNISESLAGRVIVLELEPMSLSERLGGVQRGEKCWLEAILDARQDIPELKGYQRIRHDRMTESLFSVLWRGGYPRVLDLDDSFLGDVFRSYVQTYVERDIRMIAEVSDQQMFSRFLGLCAALTAQEINFSQLGRDIGVTPQTAGRWLSILKATYLWVEIPAYSGNTIKRLSEKPKGYLADTGLTCYLQRISSPPALSAHPLLGALFETHVVLDIRHHFACLNVPPQCYQWRTYAGAEVDLILERDGIFWPVEIKCKTTIAKQDIRGIMAFRQTYPFLRWGPGLVIAPVNEVMYLPERIVVIPYDIGTAKK